MELPKHITELMKQIETEDLQKIIPLLTVLIEKMKIHHPKETAEFLALIEKFNIRLELLKNFMAYELDNYFTQSKTFHEN